MNPVPPTQIDYAGDGMARTTWSSASPTATTVTPTRTCRRDEFWCITNQTVTLFETGPNAGMLQLSESYFGAGDPRLTR